MQELPVTIKETTTIKALYAQLPVIDTSMRYLVQVLEPIPLVPVEKKISWLSEDGPINTLKDILLVEWYADIKMAADDQYDSLPDWMKQVNEVELIECDLLVPKK